MAILYASYSSNYSTLRLSGSHQPSGTYVFQIDTAVDPTQGGTVVWRGPFAPHATQIKNVVIEDEIIMDYANNLFDGLTNCTRIDGIENIRFYCEGFSNGAIWGRTQCWKILFW